MARPATAPDQVTAQSTAPLVATAPTDLSPHQLAVLRLARTSQIGPTRFAKLLEQAGSAEEALVQLEALTKGRLTPVTEKDLSSELRAMGDFGGKYICWGDPAYPVALQHISDPPMVLSILGNADLLSHRQVAMVGTRNASANGQRFAHQLAGELADAGYVITSGLARGIDTAAHNGALTKGTTIAVLGGGLDHIYPPQNKRLFDQIAQEGCIVAETPIGTAPTARSFPRRNRIIAGLSLGTVVVESSRHSGSLITGQYAGEQGREVMAIPGHPSDPRAAGPNHLIKQGALLITSAEDILEAVEAVNLDANFTPAKPEKHYVREDDLLTALDEPTPVPEEKAEPTTLGEQILNLLSTTPTRIDSLAQQLTASEPAILAEISMLEIRGEVERLPGGQIAKIGG